MKYGKTNRFGSNGSQLSMRKRNEQKCFSGKYIVNFTFLFNLVAVVITMLLFTGFAGAQTDTGTSMQRGYVVQPGRIDVEVRPRDISETELKVHNFDPNSDLTVEFKVIELTQKSNGDWWPFDTDPCSPFDFYEGLDLSKVASCSDWIKLEKNSVTISPKSDAVIDVKINTPLKAKAGFHGATIMASTRAKESETTLTPMVIRTGIPVVANVQKGVEVHNIAIQDIGMKFIESEGPVPGKVLLNMKVKNSGTTFPRLKPAIRVRGFIGGHWKLITTHEFNEIGIIPGKELNLESDIGRSLPSAKYRLDAVLYVNQELRGKGSRLNKEIDFEGDPMITNPASDVPLDLDPGEIIIDMKPGLRRPVSLKVHAAVEEKFKVQPFFDVPKSFKGIVHENVKIEDALTCLKWLTIEPKELSLEEFLTRSFRINAQMPKDALQYPNYYATLGLRVVYPNNQVADTTWVNLCVKNTDVTSETEIICSSIDIEELNAKKSEYLLQAGFKNIGTAHVFPTKVRTAVVKTEGYGYTSAMLSTNKLGMFLPYETRYYTGFLDFSSVPADDYNLEVLMDYPEEQTVRRQVRIRVREVGDRRLPVIIDKNVKSTELIPVKWY